MGKTLIIGLGNPILGDDGVGWKVAQETEKRLGHLPAALRPAVECLALSGIALMEQMIGFSRAILIDSLNTGQRPQGEVVTFCLADLQDLLHGHSASAHDASLKTALQMGRSMGAALPADDQVFVVAVEAQHVYDFTEELSPVIAAAVPRAVEQTLALLNLEL